MNRTLIITTAVLAFGALTACATPLAPSVDIEVDRPEVVVPASEPGVEAGHEVPCVPRDEFGGACADGVPCVPRDEWGGACVPPTPSTTTVPCERRDEWGGQCDPSLTDEERRRGGG